MAGATHILVPGMPDLGLTPHYLAMGPTQAAEATDFSFGFDQTLQAELKVNFPLTSAVALRDLNYCVPITHTWRIGVRFSTLGWTGLLAGLQLATFSASLAVSLDGWFVEVYPLRRQ